MGCSPTKIIYLGYHHLWKPQTGCVGVRIEVIEVIKVIEVIDSSWNLENE